MKKAVQEYIKAYSNIFSFFKVDIKNNEFFIKPMLNFNWVITDKDGFYIVSYWNDNTNSTDAVIIKKNNKPLIYETRDYTLVIAIECVKIGFIFKNIKLGGRN